MKVKAMFFNFLKSCAAIVGLLISLGVGAQDGSVALSDFCQKMALILLNNFCWELLNATEPEFSHQRGRALRGAGDLDGGMTLYPAFRSNS